MRDGARAMRFVIRIGVVRVAMGDMGGDSASLDDARYDSLVRTGDSHRPLS